MKRKRTKHFTDGLSTRARNVIACSGFKGNRYTSYGKNDCPVLKNKEAVKTAIENKTFSPEKMSLMGRLTFEEIMNWCNPSPDVYSSCHPFSDSSISEQLVCQLSKDGIHDLGISMIVTTSDGKGVEIILKKEELRNALSACACLGHAAPYVKR